MIVNEEKEEYNYYAMEKEKKNSRWSFRLSASRVVTPFFNLCVT